MRALDKLIVIPAVDLRLVVHQLGSIFRVLSWPTWSRPQVHRDDAGVVRATTPACASRALVENTRQTTDNDATILRSQPNIATSNHVPSPTHLSK